jgi:16S rRNA C967 or C1407 C5-methylase (RsmB/RsmF family)
MCAAPGSKTSQILEIVSEIPSGCLEPVGCVVANDADPKRAYMLVHQLKRIPSPAALVTSCDAQFFPLLKHFHKDDPTYEGMFDRVLADVPCTGDGTMRKNPQVWKTWSCLNSLSLHPMQLAIALNGARLTKVGGYLCYSTCAMSPIENEAVVAELLRTTDGALELIDRRVDLPGLKARPGWSYWKVMREEKSNRKAKNEANKRNSKMQARRREFELKNPVENDESLVTEAKTLAIDETETAVLETDSVIAETVDASEQVATTPKAVPQPLGPPPTWEESVLKARCESEGFSEYKSFDEVEENWQRTIRRSTFPPTDEEVRTMQLHKCLRLVSHDMDTNGFFVALFRKVQPLSQRARDKSAKLAAELRKDTGGDPEGKEQPFSPAKKKAKVDVEKDDNGAVVAKDDASTSITSTTAKDSDNNPTSIADIPAGEGDTVESPASKVTMSVPSEAKIVKGKTARGALRGNLGNENFVPVTESNLLPLLSYYGFREDFPQNQIMARGSGDNKVFSFISKSIKKYMDAGIQDRITIINSGLKCFERNNNECDVNYRVGQEGIHFLSPYMINRKFVVTIKDFITCFRHSTTNTTNFNTIPISSLSPPLQENVRALSVGSFLVVLEGYEHDISKKLMMVMWRCRGDNINCLVCKVERDGMRSKMRAITGESLEDDNDDNVHPSSISPDAQDEEGGDDKGDHDDNLILGGENEDES